MSFDRALTVALGEEGGYSDHPRDPGGKTNLGVTQGTLDQARARHTDLALPKRVNDLTRAQAMRIYQRDYWTPARCAELPAPLALVMFDMAVNHGVSNAVRLLQQALGLKDDGAFGPITRAAVADVLSIDGLLVELAARRQVFYALQGTFSTFGLGWSRRMQRVQREAIRWLSHT